MCSDRSGKAKFEWYGAGSGVHTPTVSNITEAGHSFDAACCTLNGTITVG